MTGETVILIALLALMAVNTAVSAAVVRSGYYERRQVMAQTAIIWLVPVMGALIVGVFLRAQRDASPFDTRACPDYSENAVPLEPEASHDQDSWNA